MTPLKTFLATLVAALSVLVVSAPPAMAETPCWLKVVNDWFDGRIDNTYPIPCYAEALKHLPEDLDTYSSAADQIQRAMYDAMRHDRREALPPAPSGQGPSGPQGPSAFGGGRGDGPGGPVGDFVRTLGPRNATAIPLPLLVLSGIAFLLLAAAGASFVARRVQARRIVAAPEPAPAAAPANPERR